MSSLALCGARLIISSRGLVDNDRVVDLLALVMVKVPLQAPLEVSVDFVGRFRCRSDSLTATLSLLQLKFWLALA